MGARRHVYFFIHIFSHALSSDNFPNFLGSQNNNNNDGKNDNNDNDNDNEYHKQRVYSDNDNNDTQNYNNCQ